MAGGAPAATARVRRVAAHCVGLLAIAVIGACGVEPAAPARTEYADRPEALAQITDERITEASGIAASQRNPGCYYVHNDSGDAPRIFLIDRAGQTRLTIRLSGAQAVDYEDIALAPGAEPGTFDVCVADIGDNGGVRASVTIYRFPEVELAGREGTTVDVEVVAYAARYADGPADAEAFAVHPRTGDGYIFTKRLDGRSVVYKLAAPWDARQVATLPIVRTVELPLAWPLARVVTAADIRPDGVRLAVRCYDDGWEWHLPPGTADADFERIFEAAPTRLPLAAERQGEALGYSADGQALLTVSEGEWPIVWQVRALSR